MSRNVQRIHSGPADVTLYDSTNGWLFLGWLEKVKIKSKAVAHTLLSKNEKHWATIYDLETVCLQSDDGLYEALKTRRDYKQTIYIVGAKSMVTMDNMYISALPLYEYGLDNQHIIEINATTQIEGDVEKYTNLLGADGKFEVDAGSGMATNWEEVDLTSKSIETSFRTGNCQRVVTSAADPVVYIDKTIPFESAMRVTFSIYAESSGTAGHVSLNLYFLDSADAAISGLSITGDIEVLADGVARRLTLTGIVVPTEPVVSIRAQLAFNTNSETIDFDDAQLEIGAITDAIGY